MKGEQLIKFTIITTAILMMSCTVPVNYRVTSSYDQFNEVTRIRMEDNRLLSSGYSDAPVDANINKFISKNGATQYAIEVTLIASDWLFIEDGNSLKFLADGERITLDVDRDDIRRKVLSRGNIYESALYFTDYETLYTISKSTNVTVRITGSDGYIERQFSPENLLHFQQFLKANK